MFKREAKWMILALPVMSLLALVLSFIMPPIIEALRNPAHPAASDATQAN
jgi:hypothetical protein